MTRYLLTPLPHQVQEIMRESKSPVPRPPHISDGVFIELIKTLSSLVRKLKKQPFVFTLGIGILIVIAYLITSIMFSSYIPFYVTIGALVVLVLVALWIEALTMRYSMTRGQKLSQSDMDDRSKGKSAPSSIQDDGREVGQLKLNGVSMNQFDELRDWLDKLADTEFRDMMRSLLTVKEQSYLFPPLALIDRGSFLGQMKTYGRLDQVERYLLSRYPDRFTK